MNRLRLSLVVTVLAIVAAAAAVVAHERYGLFGSAPTLPPAAVNTSRPPDISPDYTDCTIPPNIAPLNFAVKEPGIAFRVEVYAQPGDGFIVASRAPALVIPPGKWRTLLDRNRGGQLHFQVFVQNTALQWRRFTPITNTIAEYDIDAYLAFQRSGPGHGQVRETGIYQRHLESYREAPVLHSPPGSGRSVDYHAFANNSPDKMVVHLRGEAGPAMLLAEDGENGAVRKINTRSAYNPSPAGHSAWHPNGHLLAFAVNEPALPHTSGDAFDYASDLGLYFVRDNRLVMPPQIATHNRLETFPTWAPDGRYLYFSSTEKTWPDGLKEKNTTPKDFDQVRYDLMRIAYDVDANTLGVVEPVLLAKDTGLSVLEPRVSPDGRFLLVTTCDYGSFPVYRESSDLHMVDLASGKHWPLDQVNSKLSESWHCWSTNSRWIVFASKRLDNVFGKPFFSYVDEAGRAHKPFLLPQQDPTFYDGYLRNYNAPEFITGPVTVTEEAFLAAIEASPTGIPVEGACILTPTAPAPPTAVDPPKEADATGETPRP